MIGKGEKLMVWLQALTKPESKGFVTIVEGPISKYPAVKVYEENNVLKVSISGTMVLSVTATADDSAEVDELDLRPLDLNLHGDSSTSMVGASNRRCPESRRWTLRKSTSASPFPSDGLQMIRRYNQSLRR